MLRRTDPRLASSPTVDSDAVDRKEARTVRRILTLLPMVVVLASLLAVGGMPATATQSAPSKVLRVRWGGPPIPQIDPHLSHEGQWSISGGLDYEGLTRIDEDLQVAPGAAESWQFNDDGTVLTFHLRDGLRFSDGVPVTAAHFVYGAERLCSPELDSSSATLLFDVVGCEELFTSDGDQAATAAASASFGVRALDERTLEYTFERPAPYFVVQASNWSAIPLRQELVEAGGAEWWTNPATRIGNGPFRLVEYTADDAIPQIRYARNDHYWRGRTTLDELVFPFLEVDPGMEAYRNGEVDVTWAGESSLPALEADPILSRELVPIPSAGTFYFIFNVNKEPFQDKHVRRAFAYAFDRAANCRELMFGACSPVLSMIPPGMPGAIETDALAFDPEQARQALAASSYGGAEDLPEITWYMEKDNPAGATDARWLSEQFRQVLGVELKLVELPWEELDALYADPATFPQFHTSVWFAQPDPRGWFTIWRCDSELNDHGYCNPELDALLDRADAELDPDQRMALYEDAGHMLVDDAPAVFVSTVNAMYLVKPYVTGYTRTTGVNGDWPGWMDLLTVDIVRPD
jgi:oligopeptide transport system substrate-binding protein